MVCNLAFAEGVKPPVHTWNVTVCGCGAYTLGIFWFQEQATWEPVKDLGHGKLQFPSPSSQHNKHWTVY